MRKIGMLFVALALAGCDEEETSTTTPEDTGTAIIDTGTAPDTNVADTTTEDTTPEDTTPADTTTADTTTADTMTADTTVADTTMADTTMADTTMADTTMADTTMADTAVADTAPETTTDAGPGNCGVAPYLPLNPLSAAALAVGSTSDVTVTGNICPGTTVVVPLGKLKTINIQKGTPLFLIGTQTGSLPTLTSEYNINPALSSALPATLGMFPTTIPAVYDPAWDTSTKAFLYMQVSTTVSGSTAPCDSKAGVTFTVTGHPEAVIKYGGGGTSTGAGGDAQVFATIVTAGTLAAPEYVTVTASKPSCKLVYGGAVATYLITNRIPVARGSATIPSGWDISN